MTQSRKPGFFYGYVIIAASFFTLFIMWGVFYSYGVFFESILTEFGWTRALTSGAYSLAMVMHSSLAILAGRLNDRIGSRLIMTVCGLLVGLGYLLMSRVNQSWQLYLFFGVFVGLGMSAAFVPVLSTIARWFTHRRGLMTGICVSGIGAGTMVMAPVARLLISSYGWRQSYLIGGVVSLVFIIGLGQLFRRSPAEIEREQLQKKEEAKGKISTPEEGILLREAIKTRQFWMVWVVYISMVFGVQAMLVHVVIHATGMGISPMSAATIPALIGGISVGGRLMMGNGADRIGNKRALVISLIAMTVALYWVTMARELWMLYLFAVVFGLGYGGMVVMQSTIPAELFGLRSHGAILGFIQLAAGTGGALGPLVVGHIYDVTDSYQLGFLIAAIVATVATVQISFLRPLVKRPRYKLIVNGRLTTPE